MSNESYLSGNGFRIVLLIFVVAAAVGAIALWGSDTIEERSIREARAAIEKKIIAKGGKRFQKRFLESLAYSLALAPGWEKDDENSDLRNDYFLPPRAGKGYMRVFYYRRQLQEEELAQNPKAGTFSIGSVRAWRFRKSTQGGRDYVVKILMPEVDLAIEWSWLSKKDQSELDVMLKTFQVVGI